MAFVGLITLVLNKKIFKKLLLLLVALAAGAMMGGAFLHLMPEAVEHFGSTNIYEYVLAGFMLFFIIEKIIGWRHCHDSECKVHTFAYMNLIGEGAHNFIDGLIIAASYLVSIELGIATTLAVALHEIPQELGDFGVLVYAGIKVKKALLLNFAVAILAVLGGISGYYLSSTFENLSMFLLPFAAGGFIYIASSDLVPELRKEKSFKKSIVIFSFFIIGILLMHLVRLL